MTFQRDHRPFQLARFAAILLAGSGAVNAQEVYPARAITFVVPFAAGGVHDTAARIIAEKIGPAINGAVIIDNRAGAGGRIGTEYVVKAKPDGHTLLFGTVTTLVLSPLMEKDLPYDIERDLTGISPVSRFYIVLATSSGSEYKSVKGLVDVIKSKKTYITYGTAGVNTPIHLAGAWLAYLAGGPAEAVHYKGGAAALTDLVAGRASFQFETLSSARPHVIAGRLNILAVAGNARLAQIPNVPTMAEAGLPEFTQVDWSAWNAVFAPAGTPARVTERVNAAIRDALEDPAVQRRLNDSGLEPALGFTTRATQDYHRTQLERWRATLKILGY